MSEYNLVNVQYTVNAGLFQVPDRILIQLEQAVQYKDRLHKAKRDFRPNEWSHFSKIHVCTLYTVHCTLYTVEDTDNY